MAGGDRGYWHVVSIAWWALFGDAWNAIVYFFVACVYNYYLISQPAISLFLLLSGTGKYSANPAHMG